LIGNKFALSFNNQRDSNWYKNHTELCKPVITKERAMKVKMPNCYVMIENFEIPEFQQYISINSNEEAIDCLNIPVEEKVTKEENEYKDEEDEVDEEEKEDEVDEEEEVDEKEEDETYSKEKQIRKSLTHNLKSKIIR